MVEDDDLPSLSFRVAEERLRYQKHGDKLGLLVQFRNLPRRQRPNADA